MIFRWALAFAAGVLSSFAQINAPIGGSGYLYPKDIGVTPQHQKSWTVDGSVTIIAELSPGTSAIYRGRCTAVNCELFQNGTLRIDRLTIADNKTYTVTIKFGGVTSSEKVQLNVYNLLTPPTLTASSSIRPVNGTSLRLTCNAGAQTVHNVFFYQNEHIVDCSMPHRSCNNSSPILNFNPILDIDTGHYRCVIQNPVSQNSSAALFVNVAVNVSQVTLSNNATRPITVDKDSVALKCSSYGTDVSYKWTYMGSPLQQNPRYHLTNNNSTLVISPVTRNEQGAFVCEVSNYLNNDTSNPLTLTWLPNGQITCDAQRSGQSIQLYCSWPGGYPPAQVNMMYQSVNLTKLDGVMTEIPLYQFPLGTPMSCTGTHQGSEETCSVLIDNPQYPGFNDSTRFGRKGSSVFLSVSLSSTKAAQIFPSNFSWFQMEPSQTELSTGEDFSILSNDYSSFLIVHSMREELAGRYMCKAENAIGNNSFIFNVEIEVEKEVLTDDTLSVGAIAGIVIGSVAVLAVIALTVALFLNKKKDNIYESPDTNTPTATTRIQSDNHYHSDMPPSTSLPPPPCPPAKPPPKDNNTYHTTLPKPTLNTSNRTFNNQGPRT